MQDMIHIRPEPRRRRTSSKGALVACLAATVLAGSAAPSLALPGAYVPGAAVQHHQPMKSATFRRHFYRGQHHTYGDGGSAYRMGLGAAGVAAGVGLGAMLDDAVATGAPSEAVEEAVSYCANRFKSYDPSTGTYLGYDGYEHACP